MDEIRSLINQSQYKLLIYNKVTEMIKFNEILPIEENFQNPSREIFDGGNEDEDVDKKEFQSKSKSSSNKIYGLSSEEQADNTITTKYETSIQNEQTITDIIGDIYQVFENLCIIDTNDALKVYIEFKNYCMN